MKSVPFTFVTPFPLGSQTEMGKPRERMSGTGSLDHFETARPGAPPESIETRRRPWTIFTGNDCLPIRSRISKRTANSRSTMRPA